MRAPSASGADILTLGLPATAAGHLAAARNAYASGDAAAANFDSLTPQTVPYPGIEPANDQKQAGQSSNQAFVREQRVTVLMATFNRARFIDEALASLLNQTRPPDEIIVIDDGSTDDTQDRLKCYGDRVRVFAKTNSGKSASLNLGLQQATGEWIWIFDDDDAALPNALEGLLNQLARHRAADFVYGGQRTGWSDPHGLIVGGHAVLPPALAPDDVFRCGLFAIPFLLPAALLRRRCMQAVGGFDERYSRSQDYEFMLRLLARYRGVRWDQPVFVWRSHDSPRGPASSGHDGSVRERVWMDMAGQLGAELRRHLPLTAYLPAPAPAVLKTADLRLALLGRMGVMASKGLMREFVVDLHSAASLPPAGQPFALNKREAAACWEIAHFQFFRMRLLDAPDRLIKQLVHAAAHAIGKSMVARMARGLLQASRHPDRSTHERRVLRRAALRLFRACGVRQSIRAYLPARDADGR